MSDRDFPKMLFRAAGDKLERLIVHSADEMKAKEADGWGEHEDALAAIDERKNKVEAAKVNAFDGERHEKDVEAHKAALAEKDSVIEKLEALVAEQKGLIQALKAQIKAEADAEKAEAAEEAKTPRRAAPTRKPPSA